MYCQKCGQQNDDTAAKCSRCGEAWSSSGPEPIRVSNYLVPAIIVTVLCCVPLGIPAIVFAARVNPRLQAGDVTGALEASAKAKMWCWIAFGVGILAGGAYAALMIVGAVTGNR